MSKRFDYTLREGFTDYGMPIAPVKVVDLLNKLSDENEQLKQQLKELRKK